MKNVALVTYLKFPHLIDSDNLLIKPFKNHGFEIAIVPWDQPNVPWKDFAAVILRSCWDYHYRTEEFNNWLKLLEKSHTNLWNPIKIVRWNINKKYLLDLQAKNITIIPTAIFTKSNLDQVSIFLHSFNQNEIVIKPASGASAYKTKKLVKNDWNKHMVEVNDILEKSDLVIQPYIEEIEIEGEYSFIFIDKKYSHALLKKPQKDDYRTQPDFGGKEHKIIPANTLIQQAQKVIDSINSPLLYARVDGINLKGKLYLMELELTEPYLYFEYDPSSAERFVQTVEKIIY